jgi:hypothetical protein
MSLSPSGAAQLLHARDGSACKLDIVTKGEYCFYIQCQCRARKGGWCEPLSISLKCTSSQQQVVGMQLFTATLQL